MIDNKPEEVPQLTEIDVNQLALKFRLHLEKRSGSWVPLTKIKGVLLPLTLMECAP
jgi:hypothetical protein